MGADQSSIKRREDNPSYSIGRPIDDDSAGTQRLQERAKLIKNYSEKKHDIVVVKEGTSKVDTNSELQKLISVPVFLPILHNSVINPLQDHELLERLETQQLTALCVRFQEHLKHCAEAVSFDQNALCVRIKEVEFTIRSIYSVLQERQKKYAKYAEQIQKVTEMHSVLNKVKMNVEQAVPLMERLNSVLPPDEQLEQFSAMSSSSK